MTTTPGTASTSDARKRQAEKDGPVDFGPMAAHRDPDVDSCSVTEHDQPPALPDTSGWVKRAPGDVIEAGTRYVVRMGGKFITTGVSDGSDGVGTAVEVLTPPPAPREPWRVISTDRHKPTLAKVTWRNGDTGGEFTAAVHVSAPLDPDHRVVMLHNGYDTQPIVGTQVVTDVELLHTHDPVTHVPVERAPSADSVLVRELRLGLGLTCPDGYTAIALRSALAALAGDGLDANSSDQHATGSSAVDGAEKGAES